MTTTYRKQSVVLCPQKSAMIQFLFRSSCFLLENVQ